jgi:hypothetical protein
MDLDRAQADWTLELFPTGELPELAAQMMLQGFESPAILELASFHHPGPGHVPRTLVERAFQDCGRPPLSEDLAFLARLGFLLRDGAPGGQVLAELWKRTEAYSLSYSAEPLAELARLAVDYDEAWEDATLRAALEDQVPAAGQRYLDSLGNKR